MAGAIIYFNGCHYMNYNTYLVYRRVLRETSQAIMITDLERALPHLHSQDRGLN
jgi:hypothetical protein